MQSKKNTDISIIRICDNHLSYIRARENILEGLLIIGVKHKQFDVHSLRLGGATAAANLGAKDGFFKRWKSDKVKYGYTHKNLPNKLIVTKSLGLQFSRA